MTKLPKPNTHPKSTKEWRSWLEKNHKKEDMVWLIRHKKHTGKPFPSPGEAMDEAICFGWIDTVIRRIDEDLWAQCFRKRKKTAKWSDNTLKRARRLIKDGKMTPPGKKAYELGRKKPTHDHGIPKNPTEPEYLIDALEKEDALESWKSLTPSNRKAHLRWLLSAKLPETRKKRVAVLVRNAMEGHRLEPNTMKTS